MTAPRPAIQVTTLQSTQDPVWQLLAEQREDLKSDLKFYNPEHLHQLHTRTLLVAQLERTIVGLIVLHNDTTHHENALGVGYVSTRKKYQNMGVASAMVKALFMHAQLTGKAIANSPSELDGQIYLQPVMERTSNRFPDVEFVERDYSF